MRAEYKENEFVVGETYYFVGYSKYEIVPCIYHSQSINCDIPCYHFLVNGVRNDFSMPTMYKVERNAEKELITAIQRNVDGLCLKINKLKEAESKINNGIPN